MNEERKVELAKMYESAKNLINQKMELRDLDDQMESIAYDGWNSEQKGMLSDSIYSMLSSMDDLDNSDLNYGDNMISYTYSATDCDGINVVMKIMERIDIYKTIVQVVNVEII